MEKYKNFSVPIEKEAIKIDKDGSETVTTISYKIKFIDSARFMASSLSNLVDNLRRRNSQNINVYLAIKIIQTSLMTN